MIKKILAWLWNTASPIEEYVNTYYGAIYSLNTFRGRIMGAFLVLIGKAGIVTRCK